MGTQGEKTLFGTALGLLQMPCREARVPVKSGTVPDLRCSYKLSIKYRIDMGILWKIYMNISYRKQFLNETLFGTALGLLQISEN